MALKEYILNFMIRLILGIAAILIINQVLAGTGVDLSVGMNPFSFVTAGVFGIPGVAMLYGIAGCKFL